MTQKMADGFEGDVKITPIDASASSDFEGDVRFTPKSDFEGDVRFTPSSDTPASKFTAMLYDAAGRARLSKQAARMGTTVDNPEFQARMQTPMGFRTRTTLMQLADTGNPDETDDLDEQGRPTGLGLKAALIQFGQAGGAPRRRNDATISRIAAGQELEVGDTRSSDEIFAEGMGGTPAPMKQYKKIEDMTRAEQDATVPKEILDVVNQNDAADLPMDAKSRARMIYDVAKAGAMSREQTRKMASEEIAIREELTGKSDGLINTVGNIFAQGMPTVGYGNTFLVGGVAGGALASGIDKTTELLAADIDPDTGEVKKFGEDYDTARVRGYGYGAFEALSEKYTGKVLGVAFRGLDRVTGGYVGSILSKGLDKAADAFAKTALGRGVAELAKGVQRIAGLSAVDNPATEILAEEAEQQWADKAFAQRSGDTEAITYAKNVFNEATGQIEQVPVEPGSDEEETARRQIARYGAKSEYVEAGKRQMTLGEKTDAFAADFYTWQNMTDLAEGFALQYALTLGGGALHAVQTKETRGRIDKALLMAGANNADLVRMSDEQKAEAFEKYYGDKENQAEFAAVFKDAGDMLSDMAQRMQDARLWQETGNSLKPNFTADLAKEFESGTPTVQDEAAKIAVTQNVAVQGTTYTLSDMDGMLNDVTVGSVAEAQQAAEKMSQLKQGRQADMNNRAEIAQRLAEIFAPGRKLVLVQSDADMLGATRAEYEAEGAEFDEAGFKAGAKGATTPGGTLIVNVAAATGVPDLVNTLTHETGHSAFTQAGLTRLMQGKGVEELAVEFQKAKVIPAGPAAKAEFVKAVAEKRAAYAAQGVTVDDAGAVEEVLANLNEGLSPVMRKRFGDGLVGLFKKVRGTDGAAMSIDDARRIAAGILHGSKSPDVRLYGGKEAWTMPAPAFTGDPVAQQQAAPAANAPAAPAGTAAPQGVAVTPPKPAEPTAGASEPVVPAAQQATEATPPAEPIPVPKSTEPEAEQPPAAPKEKKVFASDEEFADYFDKHQDEVAGWEEGIDFEITPPAAPKAETKPDAAEPKPEPPVLDGGTPADIEGDKAKLEAQRKKQAQRKEIEDKAKAPIEGSMGDMTAALPGMEDTDDIPLLNPVAQPSKAETKADAAPFEIEGAKFGGTQKLPGMPDQHLWEDSQTGGKIIAPATATKAEVQARIDAERVKTAANKPQPEAEKPKQSNVAKANAEVDFGGTVKQGQYAEIVGITDGRGKRVYLNQNKWGYSGHRVSSYHQGLVLNGHAVLLRTKGKSSQIDGVRIIGGAATPDGSKDWTVADWEKYNREVLQRYRREESPEAKEAARKALSNEARTSIGTARTGTPFKARLMRGQGASTSPYSPDVPQEPVFGPGRYTTNDREFAEHFGPNITEHDVSLENPLVIRNDDEWQKLIQEAGWKYANPYGLPKSEISQLITQLRKVIEDRGHDGIIVDPVSKRLGDDAKTLWDIAGGAQVVEFSKARANPEETKAPEVKPVEQPPKAVEQPPKAVEPKPKMRFASEEAMAAWAADHYAELENAPEDWYEIEAAPEAETIPEAVPVQAGEEVFAPRKKKLAEPEVVYRREIEKDRKAWEARQVAKKVQATTKDKAPFEVEGLKFNGVQRVPGMPDHNVWTDEQNGGTFYMPADATKADTEKHRDEARARFEQNETTNPKDDEEAEEARQNAETQARVKAIPEQDYAAAPALAAMDAELPAYDKRKAATTRTADSKERQAYSTPPPLAAIGAEAARGAVTVIEPTAGNGGLLVPLRPDIAPKPSAKALTTRGGVLPRQGAKLKVLANELDPARAERLTALLTGMGQTDGVTMGDYAAQEFQDAVAEATKDGKRAFLMNPPFGPADASGFKLEHRIALKTIESAVPGDTLFFIGAAPGRDAMKTPAGLLSGRYTTGEFAKFHSELNRRGWQATLHFIADGSLYRKMGAAFPVEVLLMEKTDGSKPNLHMPMRDLPARYSTWEDIRAAVAEMYDPGAATLAERLELNMGDTARQEADMQARASAPAVREARQKEPGGVRYRLSQDIELGLVTPQTDASVPPHVLKIIGRVWVKEFGGKARNPDELAAAILALPAETAEARIKVADTIAAYLRGDPAAGFNVGGDYVSMGPALREAFQARWNQARDSAREDDSEKGQVPYTPLSGARVVSPMMLPRDIGLATATALDAFYERHPEGVDAFVAAKLGWTLAQATDGRLDGSQMDTLALALDKVDDGSGFIVGSMTGAGKGRVMAALMAYHIKQGRVPVFLTAKANLFTAMWEDITAIGEADLFKPLVFNDYKAPKADGDEEDENGFLMPQFFTPMQRNAAIADGKMPKGATVVFLTYSQVQNPTQSTQRKIAFVENVLRAGGGLVMDEAHLAAGSDSNTGAVLRHLADLPKPGVVFSSATFAKRGENMTLYKRAGYSKFFQNDDEMEEALAFGKVPFQQYLAARLTEGGFYLRHELDYTGIEFEKITTTDTLDTPAERTTLANREEQIADVYNQVVRTVMRFGVLVKGVNSRLQKGSPGAHMDGEAFMSSLHNTASFIYTALKAETVANAAVKALRAGRSPVITLYNTNQALLEEIGTGNQADVGRYLMRIAEKAVAITMPDGSSASILTPAGYGQLVSLVKEGDAEMLVNAADALMRQARSASDYLREQNLPASPIDRVREVIEAAGFKFAELTGRSLMVKNGVIETRVKPRPDDVVHDFNNSLGADGKPDTVILLNSAGATGLSIHNSPKFKNQATREMFILQPAWDINEMMQTFGRVNRKDQLTNPIYHLIFTSAAGEQRNAAILMQKLRSLSANTSGVSKAGYGESADDALDFMNAMGDKALAELTKEKNPAVSSINALRHSETIRRATAISQFLPVAEQAEFIRQIQDKVAAMHENARESGMHDLEAGDIGRLPLTAEQLATGTIMRAYEVPVVGKAKILTAAEAQEQARQWQDKHPDLLDTAKAKIAKAGEATQNPWLHRVYADAAQLLEHAVDSVGRVWSVKSPVDSRRVFFIPMGLHLPPGGSAQTASDWRVKTAFNNIRGVTTVPLSIFSNTMLSQAVEDRSYSYNNNLSRKEDRTVVTGDIAKALIGNIIAAGQNAVGSPQIVRALPLDGNFASFVLLMPRGVSVAAAKRVVSAKRVPLTDVLDIQSTQRGWVEIDAGRVRIAKTHNRMGDQNGAVFSYRMATPRGARSGAVSIAQIMRATGAENKVNDTPNAQGYVDGPYLSVEQANRALAALAKLHPALAATQIISDSETVGGQAAAPEKTPRASGARFRLDTGTAAPVFFSQLRRTLEAKMPNRMTVMALRGLIGNPNSGVKAEEIEWTGLKDFLDSKNPGDFVTKAEALAALSNTSQGQARFRLGDPVRVGELRTQSQLEDASPVRFPILDHMRGGSKLVIPHRFRGGAYDWYRKMGGRAAFFMSEWDAFFKRPNTRDGGGNIDTLAKELRFDNSEDFANAFLAEWRRSRELYQAQKDAMKLRRSMLAAATELFPHKSAQDIGMVMGRAVERVADTLEGDDKLTIEKINDTEGEEAVRNRILMLHQERLFLAMGELFSYDGRNDERPAEIQDEGTLSAPEIINAETGETGGIFNQTKRRLQIVAGKIWAQNPEGNAKITDEAAAAFVRDLVETDGPDFVRMAVQDMIAQRLGGVRQTPLTKYETAMLLWYQTHLDAMGRKTMSQNNIAMLGRIDHENDQLQKDTVEYLEAARKYGSAAGQALQALKLRVDRGFNIVKIYTQAVEDNGDIALTPEQYAKLRDRVARLEQAWSDYVDAATSPDEEGDLTKRIADLEADIAKLTAETGKAKTEADAAAKRRSALQLELGKLSESATELSERKAVLQREIDRLESEIAFRVGLAQEVETLQKKVDALNEKLLALDAEFAGVDMARLAELEAQIADLNRQYAEKLAGYEKAQAELQAAKRRLKNIRKLIEKLGSKTRAKIERRRIVRDQAANLYGVFKAEMEAAQLERLASRWRGAKPVGKLWMNIGVTRNVIRALQSMGDESIAGRQLAKLGLGHPILWAQAFVKSQRLMFSLMGPTDENGRLLTLAERSNRALFEIDQTLREHPLWAVLRKAGLDWMDLTADPSSFDEQQIPVAALLRKALPAWTGREAAATLLDISNNHYAGMSNMLRFAVAAQLYEKMQIADGGKAPSEADVQAIVSTVDIFGGRGDLNGERGRAFVQISNKLLYSPRRAAANVQFVGRFVGMLGGNPSYSLKARKMMATEYLRTLGMYGALSAAFWLLSKWFSDDPDKQRFQRNWGHPAFLDFMIGQNRLDFTGGFATWARSVGAIVGRTDRVSVESGLVTGERTTFDDSAFVRLLRSKLEPVSGMVADVAFGKTYGGQAAGPFARPNQPGYDTRYLNMLDSVVPAPLLAQTAVDLLRGDKEQGVEPLRNPLIFTLAMSGEMLGVLASSLPVNSELSQEVAAGYTRNAEKLEKLKRKQQDILRDKKMSPELKEIRSERIQTQIDAVRGTP